MGVVNTTYTFNSTDTITSAKLNNIIDDTTFTGEAISGSTLQIVSPGKLAVAAGGITSNELANNSVTTNAIVDANIITVKIADSNVTTAKIANENITQAKLAANVVGNGPVFRVYKNATQNISTATDTTVSFQVEEYDTNNNFASSRFTPSVAGYYMLTASIGLTDEADELSVAITKNGSAYDYSSRSTVPNYRTRLTTIMYMNGSTDYAQVVARHLQGVSRTIDDSHTVTSFSGCLIRSA